MSEREEYNWLDDAFDEKKLAEERKRIEKTHSTRLALGCVALIAVIIFCVVVTVLGLSMISAR